MALSMKTKWTRLAKKVAEGKRIVKVRYLSDAEMKNMGWYKRPVCFQLEDNTLLIAQMDDEGNDGGVIYYQTHNDSGVMPVLN